jgi:hypothetical protein
VTKGLLPFLIMDADEHSQVDMGDLEAYTDPEFRDKAPKLVTHEDGSTEMIYAGRPARLRLSGTQQITMSDDKLSELGIEQGLAGVRIDEMVDESGEAGSSPELY